MNVPVDGKFNKFTARITFDPAKPAAGSANITIDTGSYDLGDAEYNKEVRGKEWFDSATFPTATFVSSAIAPAGTANQYKVTGKLTIKGKSQTLLGAYVQGPNMGFTFVDIDGSIKSVRATIDGDSLKGTMRFAGLLTDVSGKRTAPPL